MTRLGSRRWQKKAFFSRPPFLFYLPALAQKWIKRCQFTNFFPDHLAQRIWRYDLAFCALTQNIAEQFTRVVVGQLEYVMALRIEGADLIAMPDFACLLYTSPSPRDRTRSRMPSSA